MRILLKIEQKHFTIIKDMSMTYNCFQAKGNIILYVLDCKIKMWSC